MGISEEVLRPLTGVHKMLTVIIGITPGGSNGQGALPTSTARPPPTPQTPATPSHDCTVMSAFHTRATPLTASTLTYES